MCTFVSWTWCCSARCAHPSRWEYWDTALCKSLLLLLLFPFQLTLIVYDSAYPDRRDTSQVQIAMQRNLNGPVLNSTNYFVTIPETQPMGVDFFTAISASDADGVRVLPLCIATTLWRLLLALVFLCSSVLECNNSLSLCCSPSRCIRHIA